MGILNMNTIYIIADILVVAYLVYRVLLLIRGTRAVQMLIGLGFLIGLFFMSKVFGLSTLQWLLGNFLSSIILVVIVIFQEEIRRALTKVGIKPFFFGASKTYSEKTIEDLTIVAGSLAEERIGALIVLQNEVGIDEYLEDSISIDSLVNRKLLISIFQKESPLHDGAVVVDRDRVKAAGCFLPLSFDPDIDPNLGTRHRAALGLSDRTDAVVLVVSEETGAISLVRDSKIIRNLDVASLKKLLSKTFTGSNEAKGEK